VKTESASTFSRRPPRLHRQILCIHDPDYRCRGPQKSRVSGEVQHGVGLPAIVRVHGGSANTATNSQAEALIRKGVLSIFCHANTLIHQFSGRPEVNKSRLAQQYRKTQMVGVTTTFEVSPQSSEPRIREVHRRQLIGRSDAHVESQGPARLHGRPLDRPAGSRAATQSTQILDSQGALLSGWLRGSLKGRRRSSVSTTVFHFRCDTSSSTDCRSTGRPFLMISTVNGRPTRTFALLVCVAMLATDFLSCSSLEMRT
jgi:hypothetical protein